MRKATCILILTLFSNNLIASNSLAAARILLNQAIGDAGKRLQRTKCAAFFGPGALEALTSADYRILSLGEPRLKGNRPVVIAALTIRQTRMVVINVDGPFVNPRIHLGGRLHYFNTFQWSIDTQSTLPNNEFRVLILLHELGHLIGKFGPDTTYDQQSDDNNRAVLLHCF